jgi:hypothetical protein
MMATFRTESWSKNGFVDVCVRVCDRFSSAVFRADYLQTMGALIEL